MAVQTTTDLFKDKAGIGQISVSWTVTLKKAFDRRL